MLRYVMLYVMLYHIILRHVLCSYIALIT